MMQQQRGPQHHSSLHTSCRRLLASCTPPAEPDRPPIAGSPDLRSAQQVRHVFPVPQDMINTKKSAAAVATKIAAKVVAKKAAKQTAAEQAEVKAKKAVAVADKATKEVATKELAEQMMSAEEATPAKANKE
eukprot:scaffold17623_cov65-Phaeocystis_antarctica.AAC.3